MLQEGLRAGSPSCTLILVQHNLFVQTDGARQAELRDVGLRATQDQLSQTNTRLYYLLELLHTSVSMSRPC